MWSLEHPNGVVVHIPLQKKEIQIGRNPSSDLCLTSDTSVSRHHAKIIVYQNIINNPSYSENSNTNNSICEITDQGSRFSTYIIRDTKIKLAPSKPHQLNPGDKIKFGINNNVWTLNYTQIGILTCGHNHDNKKNFVKAIEDIGGTVFNECNSKCTHYVSMCNRITPKFILAVIYGLPITGKKYWEDFVNSVQQNIKLPEVNDFIITTACLPEEYKDAPLYLTDDRRRIFNGLNFIFFSTHQCNNYGIVIKAAGGKSYLYHKFTFDTEELLEPNMIIIECCRSQNEQGQNPRLISDAEYNALQIILRKKNRRMVRCVEILGAILFCSTKKYCNSTMKIRNQFWNDSHQKKRKKVQKSRDCRENAVDLVHQKENQPVPEKINNRQVNVSPKMLQPTLELSRIDTPVSERRWIVAKASQKASQESQSTSKINIKRKDVNKINKSDGETSRQNGCGKLSSENVSKNPKEVDIKSSKDKKDFGTINKTHRKKDKKSDLANYSNAGSGKPSTKTISEDYKKSSKDSEVVTKLKKKNLNQVDKSAVGSHGEDDCKKSSAKTISAVPEDSRNKTSKDIEDEKLEKKIPSTKSRAEVRRKNKFEDILGVLDESKKISSKDQDVKKLNKRVNFDDEESKKAPDRGSKGIIVISNVQLEMQDKDIVQVLVSPTPKLPKSNKKVETMNKKNLDQCKESESGVKNLHEDNLKNIAGVSNDSSKKSSESRRNDKLNNKRKLDDKETSQVPNKVSRRHRSHFEELDSIISLDDSLDHNSQILDHDYLKSDKKSIEDSTDSSKILSTQVKNANSEAGTSKESEEIFDISSDSEKSETDQINRKRTRPIRLKESPAKKSYNLRSQRCLPNKTKNNNQAHSQLDFPNDINISLTPDELFNDNQVPEVIEKVIISDQESIQNHEDIEDDAVNLVNPLIIDSQIESVKNCEQSSQIGFPESQEHQDDCGISNADVHSNSDLSSGDENLESALLPSQCVREIVKENCIKSNFRVDDNKTASSNKIPDFFLR